LLQRSTVIVATDRHFNHASLSVPLCGSTPGFWWQLADPRTFFALYQWVGLNPRMNIAALRCRDT
jgi:hypothetical protein